jgi:hypothetical protein
MQRSRDMTITQKPQAIVRCIIATSAKKYVIDTDHMTDISTV